MRENLPSLTAALVSFGRGVGLPGLPRDRSAESLCPAPFSPLLRVYDQLDAEALRSVYRAATVGMVDHVSLRTSAIDRGLGGALAGGVEQVVLLGAGLDARAHRLPALSTTPVFEVDHPSTQRYKRARVDRSGGGPETVRYVSVDFERESLAERLTASGFDPNRPTAWVWEGVTMYLERAAVEGTLQAIAGLSAPRSRLLVTYVLPRYAPGGPVAAGAVSFFFETLGEGLRAKFQRSEMRELLATHRFDLLTDSCNLDWARETGLPSWPSTVFRAERLAIAERR